MLGINHLYDFVTAARKDVSRGPVRLWIERLRDSFWFVPSIFVAVAVLLGLGMPYLDMAIGGEEEGSFFAFTFDSGPGGARLMLQSIAGSSITVAATIFSITIATLALTSGQFGPRLLRTFVVDRGIHLSMGTFLASFVYPLLVVRTVKTPDESGEFNGFVPHISVTLAMLMGITAVGVLIYFIHHLALLIRAPHVVETVGRELDDAIDSVIPNDRSLRDDDLPDPPVGVDRSVVVRAHTSGHISFIEEGTLATLAKRCGTRLWVVVRPGDYVYERTPLAVTTSDGGLCFNGDQRSAARDAFHVGDRRTITSDVLFGIDQLTEIAQRAMSPGINDPFTACGCVDRLGAALSRAADRRMPGFVGRYDDGEEEETSLTGKGELRLTAGRPTWDVMVAEAFDPIRRYGSGDAAVMRRVLDALTRLLDAAPPDRHEALRVQADALMAAVRAGDMDERDISLVEERYNGFKSTIAATANA